MMNAEVYRRPIYTEKSECQDCYKCVRQCPVKAIKVSDGHAQIIPDRCISCGHCLAICPIQAKKVRNDIPKIHRMLQDRKVYASLAPSYVSEFPEYTESEIVAAFEDLGFAGVAETAIGADMVTRQMIDMLPAYNLPFMISSACPSIHHLICTYYSEYEKYLAPLLSPMQAHAKLLHDQFDGEQEIGVVFFGPCIAKKMEADRTPEYAQVSATFSDLREMIEKSGIPKRSGKRGFCQQKASTGAYYPISGGMIKSLEKVQRLTGGRDFLGYEYSGIDHIDEILEGVGEQCEGRTVLIELLACRGGCTNGPLAATNFGQLKRRHYVETVGDHRGEYSVPVSLDIAQTWKAPAVPCHQVSEQQIQQVLRSIGKVCAQDEKNCGGCGYNSCRDFARACTDQRAEARMCVSHLRKLSENKANALIKTMPSGLVIVDHELTIIECNRQFAILLGGDILHAYEAKPGLEGVPLQKIVPFTSDFADVRESGIEKSDMTIRFNKKILQLTIFPIEQRRVTGGIIQDVTVPWVQRDNIIRKATRVLERNVSTVQQIAFLLGENAAEGESMLNSIISSFGEQNGEERDGF